MRCVTTGDKHRQMFEARDDLLNTDRRDVEFGYIGRQIGVAFIGAYDEGSGLGNRKVAARHAGIGGQD